MDRIFIQATDSLKKECVDAAFEWVEAPNQKRFGRTSLAEVYAVAEFLLNQKGFTMYEVNATYPKDEQE